MTEFKAHFKSVQPDLGGSLPGNLIFGIPGKDGGYYLVAAEQVDANTIRFTFTPSQKEMPKVDPVDIELPGATDERIEEAIKEYLQNNPAIGKPGEPGFSPIAKVTQTDDGAVITITDKNGTTEVFIANGRNGYTPQKGIDYDDGKSAYEYAKDGGYTGTEADFAAKLAEEYPDVPEWAMKESKPSYSKSEVGLGSVDNVRQYSASNPPPYPVVSVNGKTGKVQLGAADVGARPSNWMPTAQEVGALPDTYVPPNQTAAQVGADPAGTAAAAVSAHNTSTESHGDLRLELKAINDRLTAFFDSDNQTLDELSEIVAYITSNKALIDSITTSKVSVADIINNLTTNVANKPLSAAQGVALKGLIDAVSNSLRNYQPKGNYALASAIPTKVSQLQNDEGYLKEHQDISGKLDADKLPEAVNTALAQAKENGEFDGEDGQRGTGLLAVTTAPASYTTAVGGITPKYRMAISTIKTQAGVTEVLLGDTVRYSYYHYPIDYLDSSYAYFENRVSIRGATGPAGKDYSFDPTVYGLPVLYLTGDTTGMSKDVKKTLNYSCTDAAGNAHTGTCTVKWQGNTSVNYEKKNYTIKFDSAFEACSGWGAQEKYCFKANFTDHSHCRNVVSAKLWGKIRKNRSGLDSKLKALPNAGAIDGFPAIIMLNGEFHGLYTWNIPKDQWMFGMGGGTQEAILMAHGPCDPVRFKAPALVDEEDYEMEFVTDEDNSAWVATSVNRLINACINSWGGDLDTAIAPYLDWESAIDYYIFAVVIDGRDIMDKNFILATYNGTKWFFSAYDLDSNYGMRWNSMQTYRPDDTAGDSATFENFASKHRLFELIKRFKTDDLKARYASLRKTVLHELALAEMFENFAWAIPSPVLVEDVKLYPSIRGSAVNNVDQILRWLHHRLAIVDEWINALPAQEEPVNPLGYTNQVPLSIDTDGSVFNGKGYQDGLRLSSSGVAKEHEFSTVTGYIRVNPGDVIRIYGVEWYADSSNYVCTYDSSFNFLGNLYGEFRVSSAHGTFNINECSKLNESDVLITLGTSDTNAGISDQIAYIRVSSAGLSASRAEGIAQTGANMIVTVNEDIT